MQPDGPLEVVGGAAQKIAQGAAGLLRRRGDLVVVAAAIAVESGLAVVVGPDRLGGGVGELPLRATELAGTDAGGAVRRGDLPVMPALGRAGVRSLHDHTVSHMVPLDPPHP